MTFALESAMRGEHLSTLLYTANILDDTNIISYSFIVYQYILVIVDFWLLKVSGRNEFIMQFCIVGHAASSDHGTNHQKNIPTG